MKFEILILGITAFFVINMYYDGKYSKMLLSWKKYYKMAFVGFMGLSLYFMLKKNPEHSRKILLHANNMVKYMPMNRGTMDMLSPILDFTTGGSIAGGFKEHFMNDYEDALDIGLSQSMGQSMGTPQQVKGLLHRNGGRPTKRSVSETKKKYVASCQDWKCGNCSQQLNHTFEIDHKLRLEYGGSNEVQNLVALCRNCHGNKTAMENM